VQGIERQHRFTLLRSKASANICSPEGSLRSEFLDYTEIFALRGRKAFMKTPKRFLYPTALLSMLLIGCLSTFVSPSLAAQQQGTAQGTASAMDRGFRTGYSDGYQAGFKDLNDRVSKDATKSQDYASADRAYVETYGSLEDYKDGYRQGFEAGYEAGYERRAFDSSIPTSLQRRGTQNNSSENNSQASVSSSQTGVRDLPPNSILRIELQNEISTDVSQRGDPFRARVIEPADLAGSTVQGHIALVKRPGRVKGSGELQLAFDRLILADGRTIPFDAQVIEVLEQGVRQTGTVDPEGGVKGKDSTKDDVAKVGAGTGIGAIIGAIAGGGKGAAIGAVIGGGASTGGVLATRGKDLRLHAGQQLRIQTARETRF
jgi:hypothetical protein